MKENELLRSKFKALGYERISDLIRDTKSELTQETWGAVLYRDKACNLVTLLKMCAELNFSSEEIKSILVQRGETRIANLISPKNLTAREMRFLEKLRELKDDQQKIELISNMMDSLKG